MRFARVVEDESASPFEGAHRAGDRPRQSEQRECTQDGEEENVDVEDKGSRWVRCLCGGMGAHNAEGSVHSLGRACWAEVDDWMLYGPQNDGGRRGLYTAARPTTGRDSISSMQKAECSKVS